LQVVLMIMSFDILLASPWSPTNTLFYA
jgi:hypothetical protein